MLRRHEIIPSNVMGRPMHLWCYGHFGPPVLAFPSASGMAHEWDANGMVDTFADYIEAGKMKLYCTESNVSEAWTRKEAPATWRIKRHQVFERYVMSELLPHIHADCQTPGIPVAVSGTSLGATYSALFALKYPDSFPYALCMSGRYDVTWMTDGYSNEDIYFNNPVAFVPNLNGIALQNVQDHTHLALVCGQGRWEDGNIEDTHRLADILASKGISHERDLWGKDVSHQWPWWQRQARHHLGAWLDRANGEMS